MNPDTPQPVAEDSGRAPFLQRVARTLSRVEGVVVLALAPLLLFPSPRWTPWLLGVVPLLWLCRWRTRGRLTERTPLDGPVLVLLAMTLVSLWATPDLENSFPKLCGMILGVALLYALINTVRSERQVWLGVGGVLLAGVAVGAASLVGTRWAATKVPLLAPLLDGVYRWLPRLVRDVPRAEQGFNANQVGGTMVLFVPLAAALLLEKIRHPRRTRRWAFLSLGLVVVLAVTGSVLFLTQSRQAYLAVALALLLLVACQGRWGRVGALLLLALIVGLLATHGPAQLAQAVFGVRTVDGLPDHTSWAGRVEIWTRAMAIIRDHPLTGIGFDTFFPLVHARYTPFLIPPGKNLAHAHNIFLQVALDLGLPGLVAFIWLIVAFGWMVWRAWRETRSPALRALAVGLSTGLAAQLTFGLADAIALGQKPGAFTWVTLGLGAALYSVTCPGPEARRTGPVRRAAAWVTGEPRRWRWAVGLTVAICLLAFGWQRVARARTWLALIEADLAALQALGQEGGLTASGGRPEDLLQNARSDLLGFEAEFRWPLAVAPRLGWAGRYGADLEAASILLHAGLDLVDVGEQVLDPLSPLLEQPGGGAAGEENPLPAAVGVLTAAQPELEQALVSLREVRADRQAIRAAQVSPTVARRVAQFDQTLDGLEQGINGALVLPSLLGAEDRRTILILIQNDDELRPTGGFISGVARLVVEEGRVVELVFEDSYAVDDFSQPYPAPPPPLRQIMGSELWLFRDSNWSPDFPTSARQAVALYQLRYPVEVDGVLALDQQALRLLVTALEPLAVTGHPEPLTGENVIQALRESWEPSDEGPTGEWWLQRKDFVGQLLAEIVRRVQEEPGQVELTALGGAMVQALEQRHLLIYVPPTDPAAGVLRRAGWDGAVSDGAGDYLMVVDANLGFNKVNPYVDQRLSYVVDLQDPPTAPQATLVVTHRHLGPDSPDPCRHAARYDLTYAQMMARCYWDYVRVYVPQGSRLIEATERTVPAHQLVTGEAWTGEAQVLPDEANRSVFATFLVLAPGEETESRFVYQLPPGVFVQHGDTWRYALHLQKQPGTGARPVAVTVILPRGAQVVSASPPPEMVAEGQVRYDLTLRTDVDLTIDMRMP